LTRVTLAPKILPSHLDVSDEPAWHEEVFERFLPAARVHEDGVAHRHVHEPVGLQKKVGADFRTIRPWTICPQKKIMPFDLTNLT
jgi:hypothetical protein